MKSFSLPFLLFICILFSFAPSFAESKKDGVLPPAKEIIEKMDSVYSKVNDYICIADAHYKKGFLSEDKVYKIYFKKPNKVRIEVLEGDKGAVAVLLDDGRVKGHRGGFLSFIVLTVPIDSPIVTTIRGNRIDQANFGYIISLMKKVVEKEEAKVVGITSLEGIPVYGLEVIHKSPREDLTREFIYVDAKNFLLKQLLGYEGEREVVNVIYRDIVLNPGLSDDIFKL